MKSEDLRLQERLETEKLARWRQMSASFILSLGSFSLGNVCTWDFGREIFPQGYTSLIYTIALMGGVLGGALGGILVDLLGRRKTMIIFEITLIFGWILVGIGYALPLNYVGRFITGMSSSACVLAAVSYISELAEDKRRGLLLYFIQIMYLCGCLFTVVLSFILSGKSIAYFSGIPPAIFLTTIIYIPESPQFLLRKKVTYKAVQSISWFRGTDAEGAVTEKLQGINRSIEKSKSRRAGCCGRVFIRPILKPHFIGMVLIALMSMCGFDFIISRRHILLVNCGIEQCNTNLIYALILLFVLLVMGISALLVDQVGRRRLLLLSGGIMCLCLLVMGTYYAITYDQSQGLHTARGHGHGRGHGHKKNVVNSNYTWIPALCFFCYIFSWAAGMAVPWVVIGEILPPNSKGYCLSPLVALWFLQQGMTREKSSLLSLDLHWILYIYALVCLISTLKILCTLPETRKLSLWKIEQFFASKTPSTKTTDLTSLTVLENGSQSLVSV